MTVKYCLKKGFCTSSPLISRLTPDTMFVLRTLCFQAHHSGDVWEMVHEGGALPQAQHGWIRGEGREQEEQSWRWHLPLGTKK